MRINFMESQVHWIKSLFRPKNNVCVQAETIFTSKLSGVFQSSHFAIALTVAWRFIKLGPKVIVIRKDEYYFSRGLYCFTLFKPLIDTMQKIQK